MDTVYLALVHGPTIGAPKARVLLVLESSRWIYGATGKTDTEEEVLLTSEGGDNEDYSSDDGSEAKDDSTHEDHDAEEEDTLADSITVATKVVTLEMEMRKSHAHSSDSTSRCSVSRARNFGLWNLYSSELEDLTARVSRQHSLRDGGRTVDPLFCQCFPSCSLLPSYGSRISNTP